MSLWNFLVAALAVYLLLRLRLVPLARKGVDKGPIASYVGRSALLAALKAIMGVALVSTVASAVAFALLGVMRLVGLASKNNADAALNWVGSVRHILGGIGGAWSIAAFSLSAITLVWLVMREARAQASARVGSAVARDLKRLERDAKRGQWEDLPPTDAMQAIEKEYTRIAGILSAHERERAATQDDVSKGRELLAQLVAKWRRHDVDRRLNPQVPTEAVATPSRAAQVLFSEGLNVTTKGMARFFGRLAAISTLVGLVGIQSGFVAAASAQDEISLSELAIFQNRDEARANNPRLQSESYDAEDAEATDAIAHAFEHAATRSLLHAHLEQPHTSNLRELSAREAILREFVDAAPAKGHSRDRVVLTGPLDGSYPNEVAALQRDIERPSGPRTPMGRSASSTLRGNVVGTSRWEKFKKEKLTSFLKTRQSHDVVGGIVDEGVGALLEGVPAPEGELGKQVRKILQETGKAALGKYFELKYGQLETEFLRTGDIGHALSAVESPATRYRFFTKAQLADLDRIGRVLANRSPSITELQARAPKLQEPPPDLSGLQRLAATERDGKILVDLADAAATYADYFPTGAEASTSTPRTRLLSSWAASSKLSPEVRSQLTRQVEYISEQRQLLSRMATSAKALDAFSKVGGIVFGVLPGSAATLAAQELVWTRQRDTLQIDLVMRDRSKLHVGAFRPAIVRQALAFAADDRRLVITIMTARNPVKGGPPFRVIMHPSLIDTRLGADLGELDHYTFDAIDGSRQYQELLTAVYAQDALYRLVFKAVALVYRGRTTGVDSLINSVTPRGRTTLVEWMSGDGAWDPDRNVLIARPEYYEPAIVSAMREAPARDVRGIIAPIARRALADPIFRTRLDGASLSPVLGIRSGVREAEYELAGEGWVRGDTPLWPMWFKVHATFETAGRWRTAAEGEVQYEGESPRPFVFKDQGDFSLEQSIVRWVSMEARRGAVLANAREFVVLQRLFRCALEGRLGPAVSPERLVELAHDVRSDIEEARTPRWSN